MSSVPRRTNHPGAADPRRRSNGSLGLHDRLGGIDRARIAFASGGAGEFPAVAFPCSAPRGSQVGPPKKPTSPRARRLPPLACAVRLHTFSQRTFETVTVKQEDVGRAE